MKEKTIRELVQTLEDARHLFEIGDIEEGQLFLDHALDLIPKEYCLKCED